MSIPEKEEADVASENNVPVEDNSVVLRSSVTKNVNGRSEGGRWSWEAKQDVVQKMLVLNNIQTVSALTGVDASTISVWKKQDWWKELVDSYRQEENNKLDVRLSSVVAKSLDIVEHRLTHGEQVLNNKTGELMNRPVSMKDAARVATDLLARQYIIRKSSEEVVEKKETMRETLNSLAKEFARWAKKDSKADAEDLPFVEQVEDKEN